MKIKPIRWGDVFLQLLMGVTLAVLSGCDSRSKIELVVGNEKIDTVEIRRMAEFFDLTEPAISCGRNTITVASVQPIDQLTQSFIRTTLDRAISLGGRSGTFSVTQVFDETDTSVLNFLHINKSDSLRASMKIAGGNRIVWESSASPFYRNIYASYEIPLDRKLSDVHYRSKFSFADTQAVKGALDDSTKRKFQDMLDALSQNALTAKYHLEFSDSAINVEAYRATLIDDTTVSFCFDTSTDYTDSRSDFTNAGKLRNASERILYKCPDAFFQTVLFPGLSKSLKSYTIRTRVVR
jgi:hypothetical protein